MARFRSGGRIYELTEIDQITPRDLITFPRDAAEVRGSKIRWSEVEQYAQEIDALPESEQEDHPEFAFMMAVSIWASRRAAGDKITFGECLDEPFEVLPDTEDRQGKSPARKGAKKKTSTRRASAPATVDSEPSESDEPTATTSPLRSASA